LYIGGWSMDAKIDAHDNVFVVVVVGGGRR
jgi:hypothetical protein